MNRSKKLFLFLAVVFIFLLGWAGYDISTRTTFPGSKPQLKERLEERAVSVDDTLNEVTDSTTLGRQKQISQ